MTRGKRGQLNRPFSGIVISRARCNYGFTRLKNCRFDIYRDVLSRRVFFLLSYYLARCRALHAAAAGWGKKKSRCVAVVKGIFNEAGILLHNCCTPEVARRTVCSYSTFRARLYGNGCLVNFWLSRVIK